MKTQPIFEGTWEEMQSHSEELVGRRLRLFILPDDSEPHTGDREVQRHCTGASLLKHAGTWVGEDLHDRLDEVYRTRSEAKF